MRLSQFRELMVDEFGAEYSEVVIRDLVLGEIGDLTAEKGLAQGVEPRLIWLAVCRAEGVPEQRWQGKNKKQPNKSTN